MNDKQKIQLREKQWEVAMEGNVQMLIWLGKQYLGQKNEPPIDISRPFEYVIFIEDGKPMKRGI